jgi:MerR family mercuric resistance operon transcriptional regulator
MNPMQLTIAGLARAAGVHVETVRYYQRRGLLPLPPRPAGGIRRYGRFELERLKFIRRAQRMGFTLTEIQQLLSQRLRNSCRNTRSLIAAKLAALDERLRELQSLRGELARWLADPA